VAPWVGAAGYADAVAATSSSRKRSLAARSIAPRTSTIKILDLFAGAGGLTAGFHSVDPRFESVRAVEKDRAAAATYSLNFGPVAYVGKIEDWLAEASVPDVDVIVGGPPCQGFSTLGKRDVDDTRNFLWQEYAQTILKAQPQYFVVENVATFLKSPQFTRLVARTRGNGKLRNYTLQATILNSADFGAPQARKRAVIIGHRRELDFPGFPEPTHTRDSYMTVEQALKGVARTVERTELFDRWISFDGHQLPGVFTSRELHVTRYYTSTSKARMRHIPVDGNRHDIPNELLSDAWKNHKSGSSDVMGRLHLDRPSVTIRTEFFKPEKGRYLHPTEDRAITHFEAARLQGFPDDFKWAGTKTDIARQIGNAVPMALARAIGSRLSNSIPN